GRSHGPTPPRRHTVPREVASREPRRAPALRLTRSRHSPGRLVSCPRDTFTYLGALTSWLRCASSETKQVAFVGAPCQGRCGPPTYVNVSLGQDTTSIPSSFPSPRRASRRSSDRSP